MCKQCGEPHKPPTGKHCRQAREQPGDDNADIRGLIPLVAELKEQMATMNRELKQMKDDKASEEALDSPEDEDSSVGADENEQNDTAVAQLATPATLRRDKRLMRRAAERLALLSTDDSDEELHKGLKKLRAHGKKSGSVMTSADNVVERIDWPHMYVTRVVEGKTKNLVFKDLRLEEFMYGFMEMLDSPRCTLDRRTMETFMKHLMKDTIELSWPNARAFYERVGIDVEKGILEWGDIDKIRDMRLDNARASLSQRREAKEGPPARPPLTPAPPNMRCCMPYQKRECPQDRDHPPYTHACTYCARARNAMCRHPEDECMRKANDIPKNAKPRE